MCLKCDEHHHNICRQGGSTIAEEKTASYSCTYNFPRSCQLSIISGMSESSGPNLVYRRRKLQGNSVASSSAQASTKRSGEECLSVISADDPVAVEDHVVSQGIHKWEAVEASTRPPLVCNVESQALKLKPTEGCSLAEDICLEEASKSSRQKVIEFDSVNDSCSSSKSNVELVSSSTRIEVDDAGECSSSSAVVAEKMGEDLLEKGLGFVHRRQEVTEVVGPSINCVPAKGIDDGSGRDSSRSCKICTRTESALKMLICDNCEDAFHLSCCNPRVKAVPIDEWLCHSCLKKKHKILKESLARKCPSITGEADKCRNAFSADESNAIALMLTDPEPYSTGVRIGKGFQAEVPDWLGAIDNDVDAFGEPLELDPSDFVPLHEWKTNKPSKLCSIGNWLQCREIIYGAGGNGTICGKWRRAPLFEVQTDNWECFCSVLWDPLHADCAVPQELETDEVLRQLKYVQMLRSRLPAKRRKLGNSKNGVLWTRRGGLDKYKNLKVRECAQ